MLELSPRTHDQLRQVTVCPNCRGSMEWTANDIACPKCRRRFPIRHGIPILLVDQELAEHDELEHVAEHDHKRRQSEYFDRTDLAEFEITRPRNEPALYQWLLREKFLRSVAGVEATLPGSHALTVCGGSGMDAEFLAGQGANVIASDISLGAAKRCRERARRYGLSVTAIVADIERLPFADRCFDLVYVHDGLHHLRRPLAGLTEMARVSARGLAITEPGQAVLTQIAVSLGLAKEFEEAGNRVRRLRTSEVLETLAVNDFADVSHSRYLMYYPHQPGAVFAALSRPVFFQLATWAWRLGNLFLGRFGNKLAVVAMREKPR